MGLFGRKPGGRNSSRVFEGGESGESDTGASNARGSGTTSKRAAPAKDSLELFGADSDESDDDAAIARYLDDGDGDEEQAADAESRKVSVLTSKLSPEELFKKYDADGSNSISFAEFVVMLPDLGINLTEAKARRIFRRCDTDGGGEIDLTEFKMAMFAVDPVSGNTLGFSPSTLLNPRDAFDLFDADGTGKIDELEFADVLEYFGMDVSDAKQEQIFKKYDKDKSGYIDFQEFRSMWLRLANVREELEKRGIEIPKYATQSKLQQMLEAALDEEEARDAEVLAEAERFRAKQREKELREELGRKAIVRAEDELAAALDAAGQVYVVGCGKYNEFEGKPVVLDEELFPGSAVVSKIWASRVDPSPTIAEHDKLAAKSSANPPSDSPPAPGKRDTTASTASKAKVSSSSNQAPQRDESKYVRRREENKRWKFESPPRLNNQTFKDLKRLVRFTNENERANAPNQASSLVTGPETSEVKPLQTDIQSGENEELAKLFFEDREFVRSLRFRTTSLMTNTGSLWGRNIMQGAIADNVAYAVASDGSVYTWGGRINRWEPSKLTTDDIFDVDTDEISESVPDQTPPTAPPTDDSEVAKLTARSALMKMSTPTQLHDVNHPIVEIPDDEELDARKQQDNDKLYERLKLVVKYFDVWEPPPSHATRLLFMQQVLLAKLNHETLMASAQIRGLTFDRVTTMDLILALAECFELELEVKDEPGHLEFKQAEARIREYSADKRTQALVQPERDKFLDNWKELALLREQRIREREQLLLDQQIESIQRTDIAFEAQAERRIVQLEDLTREYTPRGLNYKIEMSGITARGPPLHSPRGGAAVAMVSAGNSHAAFLMHNGSLYTCGIGASGRLGLHQNELGGLCYDSDHPQLVQAFSSLKIRHVSCANSHSAAIDSNGALYTWGSAVSGQLGVGVVEDQFEQHSVIPLVVKMPGKRSIRSVSCGAAHTGAVTTAGELFMWGSANGGRLGLGPRVTDMVAVPTLVKELASQRVRVWQVSCGTAHSACCSEVVSESRSGSKKLQGGQVFVCGGPMALGHHAPSWELVTELNDVGVRQVSCGTNHTGAVSAYGELYTWGRNRKGCTGHDVKREFVEKPELLRCFHVEPYNLALDKPCRQISVYNEQGPQIAVDGDIDGALAKCIHTQVEDQPWWEVDLGQPAVIEKIRVWNRTDEPTNPSRKRYEFTARLFPCWIMVSESPFEDLPGKEGLRAAKVQSTVFEQFCENKRLTEWIMPTAHTVGQFVRLQLQSDRAFLHVAQVEVFGVYSAFKYVGRVGAVHCGNEATMVVVPPEPHQSALDDYYQRAVLADADNAVILRQLPAYERSYRSFGRGDVEDVLLGRTSCRLCRAIRKCEICDFYAGTRESRDETKSPTRATGDRLGLKELVQIAVEDKTLEAESQQRENAERARLEREQQAQREREEAEKRPRGIATKFAAAVRRWPLKPSS